MKGYFFYQNPGEQEYNGYECEVTSIDSLDEFKEGFLVTTFNKEHLFELKPFQPASLEVLENITLDDQQNTALDYHVYKKVVEKAIEFCKDGNDKVVISRLRKETLPEEFSLKVFFQDLCGKYSHSFNYCLYLEGGSVWVGATPEVLIQSVSNHSFVYALAGSRDVEEPFEWTSKERDEQQLVTDRIAQQLTDLGVDYVVSEPRTVRAGNLEHLLSKFKFETEDALGVADQLHPTPAVCGVPRDAALDFIRENEGYDRRFYAGIIGWKKGDDISLYVNLRCSEINSENILFYVGGGITKDSDPEKEWTETNIKSQTLLSVLKKN